MRKILIIAGGFFITLSIIQFLISNSEQIGLTIVGVILVVAGILFSSLKKKWLVSSMVCLFFGIVLIVSHFNSYQNIWCWHNGWDQVLFPLPPEPFMDAYLGVYNCHGFLVGPILGAGILAIGILIIIINRNKKIEPIWDQNNH